MSPRAAKRPCRVPSCAELVSPDTPCKVHGRKKDERHESERQANEPHRWIYKTARWAKARKRMLTAHPICQHCEQQGRVTLGTDVHHSPPLHVMYAEGWLDRGFDDPECLTVLCVSCHRIADALERQHRRTA